jgi:hypothetical protein
MALKILDRWTLQAIAKILHWKVHFLVWRGDQAALNRPGIAGGSNT